MADPKGPTISEMASAFEKHQRELAHREGFGSSSHLKESKETTEKHTRAAENAAQAATKHAQELNKLQQESEKHAAKFNETLAAREKHVQAIAKTEAEIYKAEKRIEALEKSHVHDAAKKIKAQQDVLKTERASLKLHNEMFNSKHSEVQATHAQTEALEAQLKTQQKLHSESEAAAKSLQGQASKSAKLFEQSKRAAGHNFLAGSQNTVRGILEAKRAATGEKMAAFAEHGGADSGGITGTLATMAGDVASSGGNPYIVAAKWGGRAALAGLKMSFSVTEDLLKLSGQYMKTVDGIPDTFEQASHSLSSYTNEFKTAYAVSLKETALLGVSSEESRKSLAEMSDIFQLKGEGFGKQLGAMNADLYKFAALTNQSADAIRDSMGSMFLDFGHSAEQAQADMASTYNVFHAFNQEAGHGNLRMADFNKILFESAKDTSLWNFNVAEAAGTMSALADQTLKAGFSQTQLNNLQKKLLGPSGKMGAPEAVAAGMTAIKGLLDAQGKALKGTEMEEALTRGGFQGASRESMKKSAAAWEAGANREVLGMQAAPMLTESKQLEGKLVYWKEQLAGQLKGGPQELAGLRQIVGGLFHTDQLPEIDAIIELMKKSGGESEQASANWAKKAASGADKKASGSKALGLAQTTSMGVSTAAMNTADALSELSKVTYLAADAMGLLNTAHRGTNKEAELAATKRAIGPRATDIAAKSIASTTMSDAAKKVAADVLESEEFAAKSEEEQRKTLMAAILKVDPKHALDRVEDVDTIMNQWKEDAAKNWVPEKASPDTAAALKNPTFPMSATDKIKASNLMEDELFKGKTKEERIAAIVKAGVAKGSAWDPFGAAEYGNAKELVEKAGAPPMPSPLPPPSPLLSAMPATTPVPPSWGAISFGEGGGGEHRDNGDMAINFPPILIKNNPKATENAVASAAGPAATLLAPR